MTPAQIDEITLPQWFAIAEAGETESAQSNDVEMLRSLTPEGARQLGFKVLNTDGGTL